MPHLTDSKAAPARSTPAPPTATRRGRWPAWLLAAACGVAAWQATAPSSAQPAAPSSPSSAPAMPTRPLASAGLLSGEILAIPSAERPEVQEAWRQDAVQRGIPLRSLVSDDDADLRFLDTLLEGKRVVQLGESAHGVAEFYLLKTRLIKYLHRRLGYDVIAFESPITSCHMANGEFGKFDPATLARFCLFANFTPVEMTPLFDYVAEQKSGPKPLDIAGFDAQDYTNAIEAVWRRRVKLVDELDPALARRLDADQRQANQWVGEYFGSGGKTKPDPAAQAAAAATFATASALLESRAPGMPAEPAIHRERRMVAMDLRSRGRLLAQMADEMATQMSLRDALMADNLDTLLDRLYPGRKVVVWAHNSHIEKVQNLPQWKPMGAWVAARRAAEVYTIGLFMGRGTAAWNTGKPYDIALPPAGSFDAVMAQAGHQIGFVDFSKAKRETGTAWMFEPIATRGWGVNPYTMVPSASYEAAIYIHASTPPTRR